MDEIRKDIREGLVKEEYGSFKQQHEAETRDRLMPQINQLVTTFITGAGDGAITNAPKLVMDEVKKDPAKNGSAWF